MNADSTLGGPGDSGAGHPGPGLVGRGLLAMVRWYRDAVSPALPPRCRFYPTCSSYAVTALERYGPARGGWLALRRLVRCGPWNPGGVDHVPGNDIASGNYIASGKDVGPQRRSPSQETAVV